MDKYITLREKSYPNPYGAYKMEIARYNPTRRARSYEISEERANRVLDIVGRDWLEIELDGGTITISSVFPHAQ